MKPWFVLALLVLPLSGNIDAQVLSPRAAAIRDKVAQLAPQAKISVIMQHGPEEFGKLQSIGSTSFDFYDVDSKSNITANYDDVKKVKRGYGGYNFVSRRHTDRDRGIIVVAIAMGVLAALIATAATQLGRS